MQPLVSTSKPKTSKYSNFTAPTRPSCATGQWQLIRHLASCHTLWQSPDVVTLCNNKWATGLLTVRVVHNKGRTINSTVSTSLFQVGLLCSHIIFHWCDKKLTAILLQVSTRRKPSCTPADGRDMWHSVCVCRPDWPPARKSTSAFLYYTEYIV